MNCPACQSTLLFSEDRGVHCDECDDFDFDALVDAVVGPTHRRILEAAARGVRVLPGGVTGSWCGDHATVTELIMLDLLVKDPSKKWYHITEVGREYLESRPPEQRLAAGMTEGSDYTTDARGCHQNPKVIEEENRECAYFMRVVLPEIYGEEVS